MKKYILPALVFSFLMTTGVHAAGLFGGSDDAAKGTGKETNVRDSSGEESKVYSTKYAPKGGKKAEELAYEMGGCQIVKTDNKPVFKVKPVKNKDLSKPGKLYEIKGKASAFSAPGMDGIAQVSKGGDDGFNARAEQIVDISNPYSPRHRPDWDEKQSGSFSYASAAGDTGGGVINGVYYSYTYVCGRKEVFPPEENSSEKKAWEDGFDYYKRVQENNAGSILVDTLRDSAFKGAFPACYAAQYVICEYATEGMADCEVWATRACEDILCRAFILPPVKPENNLKFAYNNSPEGPSKAKEPDYKNNDNSSEAGGIGSATGGTSSTTASTSSSTAGGVGNQYGITNTQDLPYIYKQDRKGESGSGGKITSLSYYYSEPKDSFGYNGPPIAFPQTGLPATMAVLKHIGCDPSKGGMSGSRPGGSSCKNLDKLEYWRTTVVGVNEGYDAEGTNEMSKEAHDNSGQVGGWEELVRYQADCISKFGLNCICNRREFAEGSSTGHVLRSSGSAVVIGNEIKKRERTVPIKDSGLGGSGTKRNPTDVIVENKSAMSMFSRVMPTTLNGFDLTPTLGKKGDDGQTFPSANKDGSKIMKGLDNAKAGDIITLATSKTNSGVKKRPYMTYEVLEVRERDKCIIAQTQDKGAFRNSAGFSESHGSLSQTIMCKKGSGGGGSGSATGSGGSSSGGGIIGQILNFMGGTFNIKGGFSMQGGSGGEYPSCVNVYAAQCTEPDWDLYTVERREKPNV